VYLHSITKEAPRFSFEDQKPQKEKIKNSAKRNIKMNIQPPPPTHAVPVAAAPALPQWKIEANILNLQGEHRLLHQLLREFHSFSRDQCA